MEIIKVEKGCLTILTGKTDMGKSTITVYECGENLRAGEKVIFFSYEYCQSIIYNKLISHFNLSWSQLLNLNIKNLFHRKHRKHKLNIILIAFCGDGELGF